jgi:hypothetical protein
VRVNVFAVDRCSLAVDVARGAQSLHARRIRPNSAANSGREALVEALRASKKKPAGY